MLPGIGGALLLALLSRDSTPRYVLATATLSGRMLSPVPGLCSWRCRPYHLALMAARLLIHLVALPSGTY